MSESHAPKALVHQDSIVEVQGRDIGDSTQGHQVKPMREFGWSHAAPREETVSREEGAHSTQHVVDNAHSGKRLACELTPWRVRIDNGARRRQFLTRKVMVGDDYVDASTLRQFDPGDARHAVVHRDDQRGFTLQRDANDFRRQAVSECKPVRDKVVDALGAKGFEKRHCQRRTGGTVGIEIAEDQDRLAALHRARDPRGCGVHA